MGTTDLIERDMTSTPDHDLEAAALAGDRHALAALFDRHRARLLRMVRLRIDRRLAGRVDPDDVLQDSSVDALRRLDEYRSQYAGTLPLHLWFRLLVGQRLVSLHRYHLGTQARDPAQEVTLHRGAWPEATSASLAAQLLGKLTAASRAAIRAEQRQIVREALNAMGPIDREVLVLRHFEQLSNEETAAVLGLKKTTASQRYVRALRRLAEVLASIPGLGDAL
jgi:RNA polymerase sigma-70 factor (ECF subfamily)